MEQGENRPAAPAAVHPVRAVLDEFFCRCIAKRDVEQCLALVSDQIYGVGSKDGEVAIGKEAFRTLLQTEIAALPDTVRYAIVDYVQKERVPGCWGCFCNIQTQATLSGMQTAYRMRLTAGVRREGERYLIDTLHVSTGAYQEEGEFFPLDFLSRGVGALNRETRRALMEIIGQIMPGGIVGGYVEDGFPLYTANEQLLSMAGYESYEEFNSDIGGMVINSIHPEDRIYVDGAMRKLAAPGDQYEIEYRMKKKDGSYFWVHDVGRKTVAADGRAAIISVLIDFSQQVCTKARLEFEAISDPLTGICNRKGGQRQIARMMPPAANYLFLMLDLDNFKRVNDIYGHRQGDQVLNAVAGLLTKSFCEPDVVFRMGGDEFAVFLKDCRDLQEPRTKIEGILESYRQMIESRYPAAKSTMSAGGVYGRKERSFIELYQLADEVLYEVKNGQKGRLKIRVIE